MAAAGLIRLRGVAVHNLQSIDLDIPRRRLVVLCGVSGSGKSSLALDTLYAEGQRRYIESFSAYSRQFLRQWERPQADSIDGIPPAVSVRQGTTSRSSRSTVGTATETYDFLRLLLAKAGTLVCKQCAQPVRRHWPQSVVEWLSRLPGGTRYMVAFAAPAGDGERAAVIAELQQQGFSRAIVGGRVIRLDEWASSEAGESNDGEAEQMYVVLDRLATGAGSEKRLRDSLETAFGAGDGSCQVFVEGSPSDVAAESPTEVTLDGRSWQRFGFSSRLRCEACGIDYPQPEPQLFSFNSPLGACPECEGFGNSLEVDEELIVPDDGKSLREGAIAPWTTPAYAHELEELLELAPDYEIPVDVPYRELDERARRLIAEGVPEREFGGLRGFFAWLQRRTYKMHIRAFLSRWRSYRTCPACRGQRLRPEALAVQLGGRNIAQITALKVREAITFFDDLQLPAWQRQIADTMLQQVRARLGFLADVGLGYLTMDRPLRSLSGGEVQRVTLTTALGSSLVNMLYVLDEPSAGLHAADTQQLIAAVGRLRDRGNSVVVVEHDESFLRAADQVIEIGPGAGQHGGRVVFQGTPEGMTACAESPTGDYLAGRRVVPVPERRREPRGRVTLTAARGNNLRGIDVEFPLGLLCVVTGVSGSGKSSLVHETLYPALRRRLGQEAPKPLPHDEVLGEGQINDCILVDQSPVGRSPRSVPVTYVKALNAIRDVFAETIDARTRNYPAGHFSFNVEGGRCETCRGDGFLAIDMQFMADVYMKCAACRGTRYRAEVLDVKYRNRSIADVLEMTAREAFGFFRGYARVQTGLKRADRCGARLRAAGPTGQHALQRRVAAAQAGRLPGGLAPSPHAVFARRADDRPAFLGHRQAARLLRRPARRRPLAGGRGTQPAADRRGRLRHRPGARRGRRRRASRRPRHPRRNRGDRHPHRPPPGRHPAADPRAEGTGHRPGGARRCVGLAWRVAFPPRFAGASEKPRDSRVNDGYDSAWMEAAG